MADTIANNGNESPSVAGAKIKPRRASLPLIILAALFIVVPFLTWYTTWFGRGLSDEDVAKYLLDEKNPRHVQHALAQVETRIEKGDAGVKKFYPQVIALTKSPTAEIRKTTAWVMGQDNKSEEFHHALLDLLKDSEPLVRRNAALQLVRFGDASGRVELLSMLKSFEAKAPVGGTLVSILAQGSRIRAGGLLARIRDGSETVQEFRSPVDGAIGSLSIKEGDTVLPEQAIASITPDRVSVSDALRALAYVGTKDDLPLIETFSKGPATTDEEIRHQAATTAGAIIRQSSEK